MNKFKVFGFVYMVIMFSAIPVYGWAYSGGNALTGFFGVSYAVRDLFGGLVGLVAVITIVIVGVLLNKKFNDTDPSKHAGRAAFLTALTALCIVVVILIMALAGSLALTLVLVVIAFGASLFVKNNRPTEKTHKQSRSSGLSDVLKGSGKWLKSTYYRFFGEADAKAEETPEAAPAPKPERQVQGDSKNTTKVTRRPIPGPPHVTTTDSSTEGTAS